MRWLWQHLSRWLQGMQAVVQVIWRPFTRLGLERGTRGQASLAALLWWLKEKSHKGWQFATVVRRYLEGFLRPRRGGCEPRLSDPLSGWGALPPVFCLPHLQRHF